MRVHGVIVAASLVLLTALGSSNAGAIQQLPFDQAQFDAAQSAGSPIVVHVTAPWCPTCKAQHAVIARLAANQDFKDVVVLDVDFDNQPDVWRKLKATSQSTLIAFKSGKESGRLVGAAQPEAIEGLFRSTIGK